MGLLCYGAKHLSIENLCRHAGNCWKELMWKYCTNTAVVSYSMTSPSCILYFFLSASLHSRCWDWNDTVWQCVSLCAVNLLVFVHFSYFCLIFAFVWSASKTTLNGMLKEPSLIPDHILANNIYQVSALELFISQLVLDFKYFKLTFFFFLDVVTMIFFFFLPPDAICFLRSPHLVFSLRAYTLNFQIRIVPTRWQTASSAHVSWWGHTRADGHACQSAAVARVFAWRASLCSPPSLPSTLPLSFFLFFPKP